jgi:DNA ligase
MTSKNLARAGGARTEAASRRAGRATHPAARPGGPAEAVRSSAVKAGRTHARADEIASAQQDALEAARSFSKGSANTAESGSADGSKFFQVLLAGTWDRKKDLTGYWISEKYDGARAYWNGKDFVSRKGNVFEAPDWFKKGLPDYPLDGELWLGYGKVHEGNGLLNTKDPSQAERWKDMRFLIFDAPGLDLPFEERVAFIEQNLPEGSHPYSRPVKHAKAESNAQVLALLGEVQARGGEGLVAREPGSLYENKRSMSLLKIKTFYDAEAVVVGYKMPNRKIEYGSAAVRAAQLGADGVRSLRARILVDTLPDIHREESAASAVAVDTVLLGAEFGITAQGKLQKDPPRPGTVVNFKYMELSPNHVPRHPTWLGVREDYSGPAIPPVEAILSEA